MAFSVYRTVRLEVVGHASARWRGARNKAEAASNNINLSIRRATRVAELVKSSLKRNLPPDINVIDSVTAVSDSSTIPISKRGVGSNMPIVLEQPGGNAALNRAVLCRLTALTSFDAMTVSQGTKKFLVPNIHWSVKAVSIATASLVIGRGEVIFDITDIKNQKQRYRVELTGKGFDNPLDDPSNKSELKLPDEYDEFHFSTKPAFFKDFEKNDVLISVSKSGVGLPKIKLGVEVSRVMLSFSGLGGTSEDIMLDFEYGWGSLTLEYGRYRGVTRLIPKYPVPDENVSVQTVTEKMINTRGSTVESVHLVLFDTGDDLINSNHQIEIESWVGRWSSDFVYLNSIRKTI